MPKHSRRLAHAAIFAALYVVLTHFQNILLPGSASWAIQCRLSEGLSVLAFFTPAAAPGLAIGCLLYNLTSGAALPLDFFLGTLATYLSCRGMWRLRRFPLAGLLLPALLNGLLVGLELTVYLGGGFLYNAAFVALGELAAMLGPGSLLYFALRKRGLDRRLFFV